MTSSILLIDNYDSFVYNLARYFTELGCGTTVIRNDAASVAEIRSLAPDAIVFSPGPCTPREAGLCVDVVRELVDDVPMLGVCLGHQAVAEALGGQVVRATEPVHGRTSDVRHDGSELFDGMPCPFTAARYHSLVVDAASLPSSLIVNARTDDGTVMALRHRDRPIFGVQFHPESILTGSGHRLLSNFLTQAGLLSRLPTFEERTSPVPQENDFFQQKIDRDHPPPVV